jgi:hypothetical protein
MLEEQLSATKEWVEPLRKDVNRRLSPYRKQLNGFERRVERSFQAARKRWDKEVLGTFQRLPKRLEQAWKRSLKQMRATRVDFFRSTLNVARYDDMHKLEAKVAELQRRVEKLASNGARQ